MNAMQNTRIQITPRPVSFDFSKSKIHWIPQDAFSSHTFNAIHLLLPAGEFWFCRVFNKALPLIQDEQLKRDVQAFIRQEAIHARAHLQGQNYLKDNDYNIEHGVEIAERLFSQLLADKPFNSPLFDQNFIASQWLVLRVGIIAALEHFTGAIGQWTLDNKTWDQYQADPEISDLFRWHLAEEVEHRNVAFDLFHHLLQNKLGFYISRQVIMTGVFPMFLYLLVNVGQSLARQDSEPEMQKIAKASILKALWELQKIGTKTGNIPTLTFFIKSVYRWLSPRFHPEDEGNTAQALAYFESSAGVKNAQKKI